MAELAHHESASETGSESIVSQLNRTDLYVLLIFVAITLIAFIGRWEGNLDYYDMSGDASNIASFIAAREQPELFQRDFLLSNPKNFQVYFTFHFPLIVLLSRLGLSYAGGFLVLFPLHYVLHLAGYYFLGRVLFKQRRFAFLLAILTAIYLPINMGEFWGLSADVIPRFSFQTLLPYVLASAIVWRHRPRYWFLTMIGIGLLVYVHPVSTPAWGLALWLGFWYFVPRHWRFVKQILFMGMLGLVFVLTITPFAIHYLGEYEHGESAAHEELEPIVRASYNDEFFDTALALSNFVNIDMNRLLLVTALLALFVLFWIRRRLNTELLKVVGLWCAGLLFVTVGLASLDHSIANARGEFPLQLDLIRGLRYISLFVWILIVWMFVALPAFSNKLIRRLLSGFGIVVMLLAFLWYYSRTPLSNGVSCLMSGQLSCPSQAESDYYALLSYARTQTDADSLILTTDVNVSANVISIRHYSLRPLAYLYKDRGILAYGNHDRLVEWYTLTQEAEQIVQLDSLAEQIPAWIDFAAALDTDYLVIHSPVEDVMPVVDSSALDAVFVSDNYVMVDLKASE